MCQKSPERRNVGDTLTATVDPDDAEVTYQWLADGKEITDADDATLLVTEDLLGTKISVTVTDEEGNTATSDETALVKSDKSGRFDLVDDNGFQADGTALTTDTLRVSYGSDLGTPQNITWYNDGAVMAIYSLNNGNLNQDAFNSNECRSKGWNGVIYTELATGTWKVLIENTEGELWTSNEVEVVYEGVAIMSDVSIEDDYETTPMVVDIDDDTDDAILNVTFNKDYPGTLYLVEDKYVKNYDTTAAWMGTKLAMTSAAAAAGGAKNVTGNLKKVNTLSSLTNKAATAASNTTGVYGAYYEDATGSLHCKFVVDLKTGNTIKRGTSYYLIWDQEGIETDNVTNTKKKEELNTSDSMTAPYVVAPETIAVTSFTRNTDTPQITLYDATGEKMTWWSSDATSTDTIGGFESIKLYAVGSNEASSTDTPTGLKNAATTHQVMDKGVAKVVANNNLDNEYLYAKFKTEAGIFAADSVTLTSDLTESARKAVSSISLAEDSTDPYAAVVSLSGLSTKAPGTVYIMQGSDAVNTQTWNDIATGDVGDAIASAKVEGGQAKVTIPSVFKSAWTAPSNKENQFVAVYVPDDGELWRRAYGLNDDGEGFTLKPVITSSDKTDMTATLGAVVAPGTSATNTINLTISNIKLLDQFGKVWHGEAPAAEVKADATKVIVTNTEKASATVAVDDVNGTDTGVVTITAQIMNDANGANKYIDKGETFTFTMAALAGLKVTVTSKDALMADSTNTIIVGNLAATAPIVPTADGTANLVKSGATLTTAVTGGGLKLSDAFSMS